MSDKAEFVILLMADLKWLSNVCRAGLSADGEQRNRCSTFGELNEALKRVRALLLYYYMLIVLILPTYKWLPPFAADV